MRHLILPELGEGIDKVKIVEWFVAPGSKVSKDEDVLEIVTDKAVFNVPSDISGTVKKLLCIPNDEVKIGSPLAEIEEEF